MIVLVDYDNIPFQHRHIGIEYVVDRVIRSFDPALLLNEKHISMRLYGGWYILNTLTRSAQTLAGRIQASFPRTMTVGDSISKKNLTVAVELAYSLAVEPSKHLWHTYRPRGLPGNLICNSPSSVGCSDPNCPIETVYKFFNTDCCLKAGCIIKPSDIMYRAEQKLVDTMLTADLIYYATNRTQVLCIVTSDDDLWPGIASALCNGVKILHMHTHSTRITPRYYSSGLGSNYMQLHM